MIVLSVGLNMPRPGGARGSPPSLIVDDGTVTATGGYPAPPKLTLDNGTITAEAQ